MEVKSFRAPTLQEALRQVRRELGPEAAVLHTREVPGGRWWGWLSGRRQIEIMASTEVNVPSRLPPRPAAEGLERAAPAATFALRGGAHHYSETASAAPTAEYQRAGELEHLLRSLQRREPSGGEIPAEFFQLYTDLIDSELAPDVARDLLEVVRCEAPPQEWSDPASLRLRLTRRVEDDLRVAGPIRPLPGRRHVVALVGPTGVGKTTTIAKLAAHFRLREKLRVGLITVDTYRIAAVEQLRTYADIIDLPMHVVSTPKEMRAAVDRLADFDLVLLDTAGRSPRDEVKIQELRAFLQEAQADEVHLVVSSAVSTSALIHTAGRFAPVGVTAVVVTKLDEATGLGGVLGFARGARLPLSYVTNGQNVPDDIEAADPRRLARWILDGHQPAR